MSSFLLYGLNTYGVCMSILSGLLNARVDHDVNKEDFLANWHRLAELRKPTIAAVSGYAVRPRLPSLSLRLHYFLLFRT